MTNASPDVASNGELYAYCNNDLTRIVNWHGHDIGPLHVVAEWKIDSYLSTTMDQVETTVNGVTYTGRTCGASMFYRGKPKAKR